MYVYCVKSFALIECYSDCLRMGSHLVEPLATVLFNVCRVLCWFVPCCMGVFAVFHTFNAIYTVIVENFANIWSYDLFYWCIDVAVSAGGPHEMVWRAIVSTPLP